MKKVTTNSADYNSCYVSSDPLTTDNKRVDLVSQEIFDRDSKAPVDLVSRVQVGPDYEGLDDKVDGVVRGVLNKPQGYVYIPVPEEELDQTKLLASGKALLWFSTKMSGGIGRSVDLTKKSENKDDKKPIPDEARQKDLDLEFMNLKFALGLGEHDGYLMAVVNYSINSHSVEVYNDSGVLQGRYNLLDKGLDEDPENPIENGGGIKQLLRDRGMPHDTDSVEKVSKDLGAINRKIKKHIEPETGGKLAFSFVAENKGNLVGHAPFGSQRSAYADKVLHKDKQQGLYTSTLLSLGHINAETRLGQKNKYKLTASGAAALTDIKKAVLLQEILVKNLENAIQQRQSELNLKNKSDPEDQEAIKELNGEIGELQKVLAEVRPESKKFSSGANITVRNLAILELNRSFSIEEPLRNLQGEFFQDISGEIGTFIRAQTGKELLQQIPEDQRRFNGVSPDDVRGADVKRNDHIDKVANAAADDFGAMVTENNRVRSRNWLFLRKFNIKPQEIDEQVQTDVASLIHQIGELPSSDPSQLRHIQMIERRKANGIAKESRGLEFIISTSLGINFGGARGYRRESPFLRGILKSSFEEFQDKSTRPINSVNCRVTPAKVDDPFVEGEFFSNDAS